MESQWLSILPSMGSAGAAFAVAYYALQYIRGRDEDGKSHTAKIDTIVLRFEEKIEIIADKFDNTVRELHREHREMVNALFTLQKETISVIGEMKLEMAAMRTKFLEAKVRIDS